MSRPALYIVNGITLYRIVVVPLLLLLILRREWDVWRWFLAASFLTDAIDGYLARKYKVISRAGAILDSIGDDLTVLVAIIGLLVFDPSFLRRELLAVILLIFLYCVQLTTALVKYGRPTSFHTWLAKAAAVLQGTFLILYFFVPRMPQAFFVSTAVLTGLDLIEETVMILLLPNWEPDIRGIAEALKNRSRRKKTNAGGQ